jgi:hypothetical protein
VATGPAQRCVGAAEKGGEEEHGGGAGGQLAAGMIEGARAKAKPTGHFGF